MSKSNGTNGNHRPDFGAPSHPVQKAPQGDFQRTRQRASNKDAYEKCYQEADRRRKALERIQRGDIRPDDVETIKVAAALACWELRKQDILGFMFDPAKLNEAV